MKRKDIVTGQTYEWKRGTYPGVLVTTIAVTPEEVDADWNERRAKNPALRWRSVGERDIVIETLDGRNHWVPTNQITRPITKEEYEAEQNLARAQRAAAEDERREHNERFEASWGPVVKAVNEALEGRNLFRLYTRYGTSGRMEIEINQYLSPQDRLWILGKLAEALGVEQGEGVES